VPSESLESTKRKECDLAIQRFCLIVSLLCLMHLAFEVQSESAGQKPLSCVARRDPHA
jgi:hypothetical protein